MSTVTTPIAATSIHDAPHYRWGDACDGWRLLDTPELSVIEERVPGGAGEVRHYHRSARQFFYILSGSAALEFDGCRIALERGQGLHVPPGVPHQFVNTAEDDVVFLVVSSPTTAGDRVNLPATERG